MKNLIAKLRTAIRAYRIACLANDEWHGMTAKDRPTNKRQ